MSLLFYPPLTTALDFIIEYASLTFRATLTHLDGLI